MDQTNNSFTAKYLADLKADDYPKTKAGILKLSEKEGWPFKYENDKGGAVKVFHYNDLPVPFKGEISKKTGHFPQVPGRDPSFEERKLMQEKPLTKKEQKRRDELEGVIVKGMRAFVEVGLALREIKETRLWRTTHTNFDDYCLEMHEMVARRGNQLVVSAGVMENLQSGNNCSHFKRLPINEAQVRPLTGFTPEEQIEIWKEVDATPSEIQITARLVKKTAEQVSGKELEKYYRDPTDEGKDTSKFTPEYKEAFNTLLKVIKTEKKRHWKDLSRDLVLKDLAEIKNYMEI